MILISAENPSLCKTSNARRSASLVAKLLDLVGWDGTVVPCGGMYSGRTESCYAVECVEDTEDRIIQKISEGVYDLAVEFGQTSIGLLDLSAFPAVMAEIPTNAGLDEYMLGEQFMVGKSDTRPPDGVVNEWVHHKNHYYFPLTPRTLEHIAGWYDERFEPEEEDGCIDCNG